MGKPLKHSINDLAIFGAPPAFPKVISTSNLVCPDIQKFLQYSKVFFARHQYTNDGPLVQQLEDQLAEFHQASHCITFSNGFWALVLAIKCLALPHRSEVLMPSLTYRRLADVVAWANLKPRFCEIENTSLAIDPKHVEANIDANTALILAVHPIVNVCKAAELCDIAHQHGLPILFDSVESVYETIAGQKIGAFGNAECFSMHASKLINGFEGGYITTNDATLARQLSMMRRFGFSGHDNVQSIGLNAKLSEVHAAMALASLADLEAQVSRNRDRYRLYQKLLPQVSGVTLLQFDESEKTSFKNIVIRLNDSWPLSRDKTIEILNLEGALVRAYYSPPLHQRPMAYPHVKADLPLTNELADRFMLLPCGHLVSDQDIEMFVELLSFLEKHAMEIKENLSK